jgi:pimeloyl-ACP methyl ester carboxylesterase
MIYPNAKLVEFMTSDNLKLPGMIFEPKKKTKKIAIYLHGNGTSSVFYSLPNLNAQAEMLNKAGIAYLAFNNRGAHHYHRLKKSRNGKTERVLSGTAFELIKDCVKDIDAAVAFLRKQGYEEFYLIGMSTGANKICVYNYYKPKNNISKYILLSGGDDSGIYYKELGEKKFKTLLKKAEEATKKGKGMELVPGKFLSIPYSYRSIHDIMDPDGDYNDFPYNEYFNNLGLSKKKLFRHYSSIKKPALVVYGDKDEYAYPDMTRVMELLKEKSGAPEKSRFLLIEDADHGFTGQENELARAIANWLKS